ncbi:hypothetical protein [Thiothrix winogradskyi]|uniref:Uncharacterized protein n=1 Tax=Thiothrix winogradskyi TaxID=96472 RepID=A0ABY3SZ58_9GAMM|nr:hypothetical protein [Thiothrix winogradskyi]UJS24499.1 hypothetical protein L2Y54_00290 [Thiothrix winogradskyi]
MNHKSIILTIAISSMINNTFAGTASDHYCKSVENNKNILNINYPGYPIDYEGKAGFFIEGSEKSPLKGVSYEVKYNTCTLTTGNTTLEYTNSEAMRLSQKELANGLLVCNSDPNNYDQETLNSLGIESDSGISITTFQKFDSKGKEMSLNTVGVFQGEISMLKIFFPNVKNEFVIMTHSKTIDSVFVKKDDINDLPIYITEYLCGTDMS